MKKSEVIFVYLWAFALSIVTSQSTLKYDIFEEEQLPVTITDLLRQSGLRDEYPSDVVAILTLEISPHEQDHHTFFNVTSTGMLIISSRLDRDAICPNKRSCVINLDIKIQPVEYFDIIKVELTILDKNDNTPSFGDSRQYVLELPEGPQSDIPRGLPIASDPDSPSYSIGSYELSGQGDDFSLQQFTSAGGTIEPLLLVNTALDRETTPQYSLILYAIDQGTPKKTGSVTIVIDVTDANDQYPEFDRQSYEETIDEDLEQGSFVIAVRATDGDEGENAQVEYFFAPQTEQESKDAFSIDSSTGDITVNGILDYETRSDYSITVVGRDRGSSPLSSQTRVLLHLNDVNDNPPIIALNSEDGGNRVSAEENSELQSFVAYIRVTDPDSEENGQFDCQMDSDHFLLRQIHENDFTLVTNTELDRETNSDYSVRIVCRDKGDPVMTSSLNIEIIVADDNDNPPVFDQILYTEIIEETNEIGQLVMTVKATDDDVGDNAAITYSLAPSESYHSNSFNIDPVRGDITISGPVDYEQEAEITLTVVAQDHGTHPRNGTSVVVLTILDKDDERPKFIMPENSIEYDFVVFEHENANMFVDTVKAYDRDSPQFSHITYGLHSDPTNDVINGLPFRIDATSGDIYTTMELDREEKSMYTFLVTANGGAPNNWQTEVTVNVRVADKNDHTPQFVFPNLVNNTAYVSSSVKKGVLVTTVVAIDEDENDNALLHYSIQYDARDVMFVIDEFTGRITASRDFDTDEEVVVLTVTVRDSGSSPRDDTAYLNVMFSTASSSRVSDDFNEELVIVIAVLAGVVVTALILAIVCLLRRHNHGKHNSSDYLKNCNEIMNAHNIVNDDLTAAPPPSNAVIMPKSNHGNVSLDSSYQSSVIEKNSMQGVGHDNRGMVYDSDRGSFVVQPWKQVPSNQQHAQNERQKTIPEEDSDSACSLEGSNTDSGRGSNDENTMPRNASPQRKPPIPQRQPIVNTQRHGGGIIGTGHLEPGVHKSSNLQNIPLDHRGPRNIYTDNKQYYDERVFRAGAHNRSHDFMPAYHNPRPIHVTDRTHIPSPSPSLQYQPGHEQNQRNIQRQQSLNLPDVPPRKSVHYCSQV